MPCASPIRTIRTKGLIFDGRLAEDFKLTSGTWVQVGTLRVGAIAACSPVVQDMVICGEGRGISACLLAECSGLRNRGSATTPLAELPKHPKVREHVAAALKKWNAAVRALDQSRARNPAARRALDRRERDHRQRLYQSARGAGAPPRGSRAAVCKPRPSVSLSPVTDRHPRP